MKALIVVDVQNDFCTGGALAVPRGEEVVPIINELLKKFELVIFTKDWHDPRHNGFASMYKNKKPFDTIDARGGFGGGHIHTLWPDHCVQNTPGADLHPELKLENCKKDFYIFKKGEDIGEDGYSAFEVKDFAGFLDGKNVTELFICGLATDYCVKETAVDATNLGFITYVIQDACRSISQDPIPTQEILFDAGVILVNSDEIELTDINK